MTENSRARCFSDLRGMIGRTVIDHHYFLGVRTRPGDDISDRIRFVESGDQRNDSVSHERSS